MAVTGDNLNILPNQYIELYTASGFTNADTLVIQALQGDIKYRVGDSNIQKGYRDVTQNDEFTNELAETEDIYIFSSLGATINVSKID